MELTVLQASFMPHGMCYLWVPELLWLHVTSDAVIAIAYFSIPIALVRLVRGRDDITFSWVFWSFAAFILLCGATHVMSIWTVWNPTFWFQGGLKVLTAAASLTTAVLLWPFLGTALALPSTAMLNDLNRRLLAETELHRAARREAEQRNRELEMMLSATSHDLREPLRAIAGFSEILDRECHDLVGERGRKHLRYVADGARRMEQQLEGLRVFSQAGRPEHPQARVAAADLVAGALASLRVQIEETGARIEVAPGLPAVRVDPVWGSVAIQNLVSNAIKFARPDEPAQVEIRAYVSPPGEGSEVGLVIADRGIGIEPQHAERVFDLFRREVGRDVPGTGTGLAIVMRVAESHGGRAWARPRPDGGAEFFVTFGAADPAAAD